MMSGASLASSQDTHPKPSHAPSRGPATTHSSNPTGTPSHQLTHD